MRISSLSPIVLTLKVDTRHINMFAPPPTPPPAPDSHTHILADEDLEDYAQFLNGFDKETTTFQAQSASAESLPPTLLAFSAETPQAVTETSSVPYPDGSYNDPQNSAYHHNELPVAATLSGFHWNGSTPIQPRSEQYYQPVSGDNVSGSFDLMSHTREISQEPHWVPTNCDGARESNPATSPGLDGPCFPAVQRLNFPEGGEMMQRFYNAVAQPQAIPSGLSTPHGFPYGSDSGFSDARFVSPANQEAAVQRNEVMFDTLSCLKPSDSAASTRPSTPIAKRRKLPDNVDERKQETSLPLTAVAPESKGRRRQTMASVTGINKNHFDEALCQAKKGKSSTSKRTRITRKQSIESLSSESGQSHSRDRKGLRQNLTEEQKKQNHVDSEQRRRDAIRDAYNSLHHIVPSLRSEELSRAKQVDHAVRWLEELLEGNRELKRRLSTL